MIETQKGFSLELTKPTNVWDRTGTYDYEQEVQIDLEFEDVVEYFRYFFKANPTINRFEFLVELLNAIN